MNIEIATSLIGYANPAPRNDKVLFPRVWERDNIQGWAVFFAHHLKSQEFSNLVGRKDCPPYMAEIFLRVRNLHPQFIEKVQCDNSQIKNDLTKRLCKAFARVYLNSQMPRKWQ